MKRYGKLIGAAAVLASAAMGLFFTLGLPDRASGNRLGTAPRHANPPTSELSSRPDPKSPTRPAAPAPAGGQTNWAARLAQTASYRDFANAALPAARAGDRDAQFYLEEALRVCDQDWRYYFVRKGHVRSLDEALLWASTRDPAMMEAMKRTYSRCHDLKERDPRVFGQPDDWLAAATNAGQPVAQAVTASELLLRVVMAGNHEMELDSVYFPDPTAKERNPRVLLQQALQSGNSEALLQVALTQDLFVPGRDRIVGAAGDQGLERQLVWLYLACSEGADCSSTSTWVASFCRDGVACPPNETGMELISREAALINVYDLAERAQVIKGQIARRQWDDLGIGRDSDLPVTAVGSD